MKSSVEKVMELSRRDVAHKNKYNLSQAKQMCEKQTRNVIDKTRKYQEINTLF